MSIVYYLNPHFGTGYCVEHGVEIIHLIAASLMLSESAWIVPGTIEA